MKAVYVQYNESIPYTPGADVAAGDVIVLGGKVLIANRKILAGTLGALLSKGVFRVVKANVAVTAGNDLFWDATNQVVTTDAASGANIFMGVAIADAAQADALALVDLAQDRVPKQSSSGVTDVAGLVAVLKKAGVLS